MPPTTDLWMAELGQSKPYTTKVKRVVNRHRTRSFSVVDTSFRRREDSETEPFRTSLKPPAINRVEVFAEISAGLSHQSRETGSVFRRFRSNLRNRRWTIVSSRSWPLPKKKQVPFGDYFESDRRDGKKFVTRSVLDIECAKHATIGEFRSVVSKEHHIGSSASFPYSRALTMNP